LTVLSAGRTILPEGTRDRREQNEHTPGSIDG
jgi:hypothetical protein